MTQPEDLNDGHYHEIMDRAYLCLDMFSRHIWSTDAVTLHPKLQPEATALVEALGRFYQLAGEVFEEEEVKATETREEERQDHEESYFWAEMSDRSSHAVRGKVAGTRPSPTLTIDDIEDSE